jgi:DnaJ-class molecular chaperone
MRTYYQVLGVSEDARPDEIKRAYRRLVRQLHPDLTGGDTALSLRQVIQAYETLSDEQRRRSYDQDLAGRRRPSAPEADHRGWFADEIAIDFPSIADVVDRIRDAFLGADEAADRPLSAEILLSRREAFDGVTVPLEVPVRSTCPLCGGRGESWMEPCRGCAGTGAWHLPHRVRLSVPAGVADGMRFHFTITAPHTPPTHVEVRVAVR